MCPLVEDGHNYGVVGGVGAADVGVVMEKRIALRELGVEIFHRAADEARAEDVHRQPLGRGDQVVLGGDERAREVARDERGGAGGADQGVGHFAGDAVEAVGHDQELDGVEVRGGAWGAV